MADGYNFDRLKTAIIAMSSADEWQAAKREWHLIDIGQVEPGEPDEECLCGHRHMRELCEIRDRKKAVRQRINQKALIAIQRRGLR